VLVSLVIFDLDDTLIDRRALLHRWAVGWAEAHALDPAEVRWLTAADGDGFVSRPAFFSAIRERYGLRESVDRLIERYRERIPGLVERVPVVLTALEELRADGWRLAIATNGPARLQLEKIQCAGLEASVDAIAVSEEVGAAKPDARMFEAAAARCGQRLQDGGWVVGDCLTRDVAGGQGVGLHTIWLALGRSWDAAATRPDVVVEGVTDAITALRSMARGSYSS
jgi:FMN phosphatase YigB (HAD superfamily)